VKQWPWPSFVLPGPLQGRVEELVQALLRPPGGPPADFLNPAGEPGLALPDSVSWQIFRNPVTLFIGGVAAVILELAEPRVRTAIWEHSRFRDQPVERMQRTGLAAMVTVYAARSVAEAMIAGIGRAHDSISGMTPAGESFVASDPDLLAWVQGTAAFGFLEAYCTYVRPLALAERDKFYAEGAPAAALYGSVDAPASVTEMNRLFRRMRPRLEPSPILFEFLHILRQAPILPPALNAAQQILVNAALAVIPPWIRMILEIGDEWLPGPVEARIVKAAAAVAGRYRIDTSPPALACVRLGLPADYLHQRSG
jgi:uncharacterized protein (DUF2236 family)